MYQREEIKDTLAYLKLIINPKDNEALKRIINYPKRGIGNTTVAKIEEFANNQGMSMWEVILNIPRIEISLNSGAVNKIFGFAEMINEFAEKLEFVDAYDLAKEVAATSGVLQDLFKDKAPENVQKHENVQELLNGIKEFSSQSDNEDKHMTLDQYMENVSLLTNEDNSGDEDFNKVTLKRRQFK